MIKNYGKCFEKYKEIEGWCKGTIGSQMLEWCKKYGEKICFISSTEEISYEEMGEKIKEASFGFYNAGIRKGERVVLQLPNSSNFIISFFALEVIGAIPIMALPAHRINEIKGMVETAEASAYICPDKFMGFDYSEIAEEINAIKTINSVFKVNSEESILDQMDTTEKEAIVSPDNLDIAFLSLSGGTTGMSKLIPRTNGDYLYDTWTAVRRSQLSPEDRVLIVLPISHNFVVGHPGFIGTFMAGATLVVNEYPDMNEALENIEEYGVTFMALVPAMAKMMLEILEEDEYDISTLRVVQVGGSFLEEDLANALMDKDNFTLQQVFGVAEGLNTMTALSDSREVIKNYQGKKCSEYDEIKIVDDDGKEVKPMESGELWVRGPYTIRSYYNNPNNDRYFTEDEFYKTGDRAFVTEDGNLKIVGRVAEMINKGGEKIIPSEIETALYDIPGLRDCAVVGLGDENLGQKICVFTVSDEEVSLSQIKTCLINKNLAAFKIPDMIINIDELPLTKVGKVDKKKLVEMGEK